MAREEQTGQVNIRKVYEENQTYKTDTVCIRLQGEARTYTERLVEERLALVRSHALRRGMLLDVCCATGEHLFALADLSDECLGVDFSWPFIERAHREARARNMNHVHFGVADAKALPLLEDSVGTVYSFSALYAIPNVEQVVAEIARVLVPGGRCVLDLSNRSSLNAICIKAYKNLPPTFHLHVSEMTEICERHALKIIEHRRFQLLPLWADKPRWLWPLLHPMWKRIMATRVGGRMLDERVSSLPVLRRFAFRHIIVCEKEER